MTYDIKASRSVAKDWQKWEEALPDALKVCKLYLQKSPSDRLRSGGKLKKLKGKQQGILQYDLDDDHRVLYEVDKRNKVVTIKYIGPHPKW